MASRSRQCARTASSVSPSQRDIVSTRSHASATRSLRAPSMASETARARHGSGKSRSPWSALIPIPTTAHSSSRSVSTPPILRSAPCVRTTMSLGHLMRTSWSGAERATASKAASPDRAARARASSPVRSASEHGSVIPSASSHRAPRRPRPPVWTAAHTSTPRSDGASIRRAASWVESTRSKTTPRSTQHRRVRAIRALSASDQPIGASVIARRAPDRRSAPDG